MQHIFFQKGSQYKNVTTVKVWVGIAQSVEQIATGWTVQGSNASGGEIFRTRPDWPWGPPSLLHNGYQVFPGGKQPGCFFLI